MQLKFKKQSCAIFCLIFHIFYEQKGSLRSLYTLTLWENLELNPDLLMHCSLSCSAYWNTATPRQISGKNKRRERDKSICALIHRSVLKLNRDLGIHLKWMKDHGAWIHLLSAACGQCILVSDNLCLISTMASQSLSRLIISGIMAFSCGYIASESQKQYSQGSAALKQIYWALLNLCQPT